MAVMPTMAIVIYTFFKLNHIGKRIHGLIYIYIYKLVETSGVFFSSSSAYFFRICCIWFPLSWPFLYVVHICTQQQRWNTLISTFSMLSDVDEHQIISNRKIPLNAKMLHYFSNMHTHTHTQAGTHARTHAQVDFFYIVCNQFFFVFGGECCSF